VTQLVHSQGELDAALGRGRGSQPPVATVMTMGALHAGHASLMSAARAAVGPSGRVVVTVFVNPLQFGAGEDFARYPRTLPEDVVVSTAAGADLVYAPSVEDVYGAADPGAMGGTSRVTIDPGLDGDILEGAARPGHFRGVLTVVGMLMLRTGCQVAPFGEKDYQQLALVTRMVDHLGLNVQVIPVPTVRDPDGLALSSRNRYLSSDERQVALSIPRALAAAAAAGPAGAAAAQEAARAVLLAQDGLDLDYAVVRGVDLGSAPAKGAARLLIAARVGTTRLLDNAPVQIGDTDG